ncbi:MAG: hypothetical protein CM15mP70_11340 [Pelagibacteraceae bacterium]|nr:MAG: hypothetical protein CM15mP70_11340 [Pelagibacteraceae bacterium]
MFGGKSCPLGTFPHFKFPNNKDGIRNDNFFFRGSPFFASPALPFEYEQLSLHRGKINFSPTNLPDFKALEIVVKNFLTSTPNFTRTSALDFGKKVYLIFRAPLFNSRVAFLAPPYPLPQPQKLKP